jgi:hypothetical protein
VLPDQKTLLESWKTKIRRAQMAQYAAANRCRRRHYALGIPIIVLSAVTGATALGGTPLPARVALSLGIASVIVAVLAGLQTFLRLADDAEKHRVSAQAFGDLKRQIDALLASDPSPAEAQIDAIRRRWQRINMNSLLAVSESWEKESQ